jgi:hypothetical protein
MSVCMNGRFGARMDVLPRSKVSAVPEGDSIELWTIVNGADKRWLVPSVNSGWLLAL